MQLQFAFLKWLMKLVRKKNNETGENDEVEKSGAWRNMLNIKYTHENDPM